MQRLPLYICTPQIISRVGPWFFRQKILKIGFRTVSEWFLGLEVCFLRLSLGFQLCESFFLGFFDNLWKFHARPWSVKSMHYLLLSLFKSLKKMKFKSTLNISKHLLSLFVEKNIPKKKYECWILRAIHFQVLKINDKVPLKMPSTLWVFSGAAGCSTLQATQISCNFRIYLGLIIWDQTCCIFSLGCWLSPPHHQLGLRLEVDQSLVVQHPPERTW